MSWALWEHSGYGEDHRIIEVFATQQEAEAAQADQEKEWEDVPSTTFSVRWLDLDNNPIAKFTRAHG